MIGNYIDDCDDGDATDNNNNNDDVVDDDDDDDDVLSWIVHSCTFTMQLMHSI